MNGTLQIKGLRHGVAILALAAMILAPVAARACSAAQPFPAIRVVSSEIPVRFDLTQSIAALSDMPVDTRSPYPSHYHAEVGGMMNGRIAFNHRISFTASNQDGRRCVAISEISVEISMHPTIFIASDFHDKACWFREIFAHETKHVDVDRALVEKYTAQTADALNLIVMGSADYATGWLAPEQAHAAQADLQAGVEHALAVMFDKMIAERQERQQEIDSLHEYARIGRACPPPSS